MNPPGRALRRAAPSGDLRGLARMSSQVERNTSMDDEQPSHSFAAYIVSFRTVAPSQSEKVGPTVEIFLSNQRSYVYETTLWEYGALTVGDFADIPIPTRHQRYHPGGPSSNGSSNPAGPVSLAGAERFGHALFAPDQRVHQPQASVSSRPGFSMGPAPTVLAAEIDTNATGSSFPSLLPSGSQMQSNNTLPPVGSLPTSVYPSVQNTGPAAPSFQTIGPATLSSQPTGPAAPSLQPTGAVPTRQLLFPDRHAARAFFSSMPTWSPPINDPSLPQNDNDRNVYVLQLINAFWNRDGIRDKKESTTLKNRWTQRDPITDEYVDFYDPQCVELVLRDLLATAEEVHQNGPGAIPIHDKATLKDFATTQQWSFATRIDKMSDMFRFIKAKCDALMSGDIRFKCVAIPHKLISTHSGNRGQNDAKGIIIAEGRDSIKEDIGEPEDADDSQSGKAPKTKKGRKTRPTASKKTTSKRTVTNANSATSQGSSNQTISGLPTSLHGADASGLENAILPPGSIQSGRQSNGLGALSAYHQVPTDFPGGLDGSLNNMLMDPTDDPGFNTGLDHSRAPINPHGPFDNQSPLTGQQGAVAGTYHASIHMHGALTSDPNSTTTSARRPNVYTDVPGSLEASRPSGANAERSQMKTQQPPKHMQHPVTSQPLKDVTNLQRSQTHMPPPGARHNHNTHTSPPVATSQRRKRKNTEDDHSDREDGIKRRLRSRSSTQRPS